MSAKDKRHVIVKGAPRFVVRERTVAAGEKGYCAECALVMILRARNDLERLEAELSNRA